MGLQQETRLPVHPHAGPQCPAHGGGQASEEVYQANAGPSDWTAGGARSTAAGRPNRWGWRAHPESSRGAGWSAVPHLRLLLRWRWLLLLALLPLLLSR